jgi:hypothetical protein
LPLETANALGLTINSEVAIGRRVKGSEMLIGARPWG